MGQRHGRGDGEVLDIRTADIKAVAPVFHEQSGKLSDALTKLVRTLDGLGKPWGDDKQGREFGSHYSPQQKKIESAVGVLVLGLASVYEAMNDMADGHVDNDELIAGIFARDAPGEPAEGRRR
ncbi:hypothetical protein RKE29_10435 [Streptomyces sp. B1866]|uniref:hypothetical protein n=1 Tax=Streptomyces sp. B1866 TaxID=3075431 RepID=UPI00288CF37A|nr:hypothetical protein [Streptomyces sp. B1866]MDT3397057.1 hypothetical protein [Streptomyces sp. B1866]